MSGRINFQERENKMNHRHGDIFLKKADRPTSAKFSDVKNSVVLAIGEATGHSHIISGEVAEFVDENGNRMVWVVGESNLTHQEHAQQVVEPGYYWVVRQREYTPKEIVHVRD